MTPAALSKRQRDAVIKLLVELQPFHRLLPLSVHEAVAEAYAAFDEASPTEGETCKHEWRLQDAYALYRCNKCGAKENV